MIYTSDGWLKMVDLMALMRSDKVPHTPQENLNLDEGPPDMTLQRRKREANRIRKALKRDRRAAFMMGVSLEQYHAIAMYLHDQAKPGAQRGKFIR